VEQEDRCAAGRTRLDEVEAHPGGVGGPFAPGEVGTPLGLGFEGGIAHDPPPL